MLLAPGMEDEFVPRAQEPEGAFCGAGQPEPERGLQLYSGGQFRRAAIRWGGISSTWDTGASALSAAPGSWSTARSGNTGFRPPWPGKGFSVVRSERGQFCFADGYRIMTAWIGQGVVPPAIFAADCNLALGVITALREHGYRVPPGCFGLRIRRRADGPGIHSGSHHRGPTGFRAGGMQPLNS